MDTNQANKTDFAWSALLQFANRHSGEALRLLRAAFNAEADESRDRDEAKLHLAVTWATAYTSARSAMLGLSAAEQGTVAAAAILRRTEADAGKVQFRIAQASAPDAKP
jgi:hypothetical protein